ncbi:MAG: YkuS family protein [Clostridium sp.]|nr:YkuS family protein [Clostridium sp.]
MVFMVVAVQSGLENIKKELKKRGFEVVDLETYNYPIDAIVYEGNSFQISHISRNNMPEMNSGLRANYGVFIINSLGKSIDEIEDMLKSRYYSPLF